MRLIDDARICLIFFTRLPVKWPEDLPRERITRAFQAAPFVGLVVGAIGALGYFAGFTLTGGSVHIAATLAVGAQLIATGAFHEDGLADFADGVGGGATPAARLEIMRDSRIGTYGASALGLALLLKMFLIAEIAEPWQAGLCLIASGAVARAGLVQLMSAMGPAATDGASADAGQPTRVEAGAAVVGAAVIGGFALVLALGLGAVLPAAGAVAGAAIGTLAVGALAQRHLGGQTGDALGATAVVAELGALLGIVALLPGMGI
jgi:adenosylcobinamide-GDP ribazoletransferase